MIGTLLALVLFRRHKANCQTPIITNKEEVSTMNRTPMLPVLMSGWDHLQNEMDRLLGRWGFEGPRVRALAPSFPLVNLWEDENAFYIEAELPGLKQDDLHIAVTDRNRLTLEGERKAEEGSQGNWHRRERGFGRFQRIFTLPVPVDADKVEAKLENGVLNLLLPKSEDAKPRRIAVKAE
jgi:HSP20 family protein